MRPILSRAAGVLRDGEGLRAAARALYPLAISQQAASDPAIVGLMIVIAAAAPPGKPRRACTYDFPKHTSLAQRSTLRLDDALQAARDDIPELVALTHRIAMTHSPPLPPPCR